MIESFKKLSEVRVDSEGESLGHLFGFIARDDSWKVRYYLVRKLGVVTSQLLIAPSVLGDLEHGILTRVLTVDRNLLEIAPLLETGRPLSKQTDLTHAIYRWPTYPDDGGIWGASPHVMGVFCEREKDRKTDLLLRRRRVLHRLSVYARSCRIGRISEFLIDTESSKIRYFVVRQRKFLSLHHFLISPDWFESISFSKRRAILNMDLSFFSDAPDYQPGMSIDRETEIRLYSHYGRPGYWLPENRVAV